MSDQLETATLGGGCFWCVEAALEQLAGVDSVVSGYAGGRVEDPTYRQVCGGEVHDPTQLNRQGPDVGRQYRSIVLYHSEAQRETAAAYIEALDEEYDDDVVTELDRLETFYRAEEHHQDYFAKNPDDAYCTFHAKPKMEKVREKFEAKVAK